MRKSQKTKSKERNVKRSIRFYPSSGGSPNVNSKALVQSARISNNSKERNQNKVVSSLNLNNVNFNLMKPQPLKIEIEDLNLESIQSNLEHLRQNEQFRKYESNFDSAGGAISKSSRTNKGPHSHVSF